MKLLDLTLPTPAENLALDDAILEQAETGTGPRELLRLWEMPQTCVVVGFPFFHKHLDCILLAHDLRCCLQVFSIPLLAYVAFHRRLRLVSLSATYIV